MRRRSSSHRRKRHRLCHRRKPPSLPHRRTGSHGHSHSWCNYFERSRWRCRPRRDPRCRENWPGRRDRDRAVRQHHRDEADHRRCRAEVRPRPRGKASDRSAEHHREEDRRRPDPEEDHRRRGQEGDQRGLAADPEEGRTARARHLARRCAAPNITLTDSIRRFFFDMCMSFDLEFWSDGDGFHPLARHGQAKRRRQGLQSTIGSRAAAATVRLARCSRCVKESRARTNSISGRRCGRCGHPGCSPARPRSAGRDQA